MVTVVSKLPVIGVVVAANNVQTIAKGHSVARLEGCPFLLGAVARQVAFDDHSVRADECNLGHRRPIHHLGIRTFVGPGSHDRSVSSITDDTAGNLTKVHVVDGGYYRKQLTGRARQRACRHAEELVLRAWAETVEPIANIIAVEDNEVVGNCGQLDRHDDPPNVLAPGSLVGGVAVTLPPATAHPPSNRSIPPNVRHRHRLRPQRLKSDRNRRSLCLRRTWRNRGQ